MPRFLLPLWLLAWPSLLPAAEPDCNENGVPDRFDLEPTFRLEAPLAFPPLNGYQATDFDGDGRTDLVGLTHQEGHFRILFQRAAGEPFEEKLFEVEDGMAVADGDLDGDGRTDLVVSGRAPRGSQGE